MGIKERKERHQRDVRNGILSAAREIASNDGWHSVTIRRIAERIEYSPPAIYEYFDSKEELLLELLRMGYAEQLEAVENARTSPASPEEALRNMARAWWRFSVESPDLYQVMYGLGGVSFPVVELRKEGEKIGEVVGNVVKEILNRNDKEVTDVEGKVALLWSTIHGLVTLSMAGRIVGGKEQAERLVDRAVGDYLRAWVSS